MRRPAAAAARLPRVKLLLLNTTQGRRSDGKKGDAARGPGQPNLRRKPARRVDDAPAPAGRCRCCGVSALSGLCCCCASGCMPIHGSPCAPRSAGVWPCADSNRGRLAIPHTPIGFADFQSRRGCCVGPVGDTSCASPLLPDAPFGRLKAGAPFRQACTKFRGWERRSYGCARPPPAAGSGRAPLPRREKRAQEGPENAAARTDPLGSGPFDGERGPAAALQRPGTSRRNNTPKQHPCARFLQTDRTSPSLRTLPALHGPNRIPASHRHDLFVERPRRGGRNLNIGGLQAQRADMAEA